MQRNTFKNCEFLLKIRMNLKYKCKFIRTILLIEEADGSTAV